MDAATEYSDAFPVKSKGVHDASNAFKEFVGIQHVTLFYSDNSPELKALAKMLVIPHATSTPYRPQSNGTIEREVGLVKHGARTLILQAGVDHSLWPYAVRFICFARNTSTKRGMSK